MQRTIIPLTFLTVAMNPYWANQQAIATGSAASMEWCASSAMPTQSYVATSVSTAAAEPALPLIALANALLPESRPMTDWERKDAEEFFWSQFA